MASSKLPALYAGEELVFANAAAVPRQIKPTVHRQRVVSFRLSNPVSPPNNTVWPIIATSFH